MIHGGRGGGGQHPGGRGGDVDHGAGGGAGPGVGGHRVIVVNRRGRRGSPSIKDHWK